MVQVQYKLRCKCGNDVVVKIDSRLGVSAILHCQKCRELLLDTDANQSHSNGKDDGETLSGSAVNSEMPKLIPTETQLQTARRVQLDNYTVVKQLGEGGMGKVYLAVDRDSGQKVAIKILYDYLQSKWLDYFIQEAQILLELQHPNIIALQGWGNYQGYPYLAMEYITGNTLREILARKNRLAPRHLVQLVSYVLDALHYAWQHQVIHRDIKPSNILIASNGAVKLIDFGIGKVMEESHCLTTTGRILGTAYYMPAEQLQDGKRADHRADIYAVGATLYHALSGKPPFSEYAHNVPQLVCAKIDNIYTPLAEHCPELPPQLIAIITRAMAGSPQERYASALDMKSHLLAVLPRLR